MSGHNPNAEILWGRIENYGEGEQLELNEKYNPLHFHRVPVARMIATNGQKFKSIPP
jgi:hypothetical protein